MFSNNKRVKFGYYLIAVLLSTTLMGCSLLPQSAGLQSYLLPSNPGAATSQPQLAQTLRIMTPQTNQFLNSLRIAVQPVGDEISVYKGVRWNDTAPVVLRERLLEEFRHANALKWVISEQEHLQVDKELRSDLTAFQLVYAAGGSKVLIRLNASLINLDDRTVLANRNFEITQPVSGKATADIVTAFGLASDQLAQQLLRWSVEILQ